MGFNQRLGREITPTDSTWGLATNADRLAFFREAGRAAKILKKAELDRAIGANGRRMASRKRPRPDGATGPVLTPHADASRTVRLMDAHADPGGMTLYWRSGHSRAQKLPWGTILGFHAAGQVKGAPIRDVRLSKRGIASLRMQMLRWWAANLANQVADREEQRIAAIERAARSGPAKRAARKVQDALVKKNKKLAAYFSPRGGGF